MPNFDAYKGRLRERVNTILDATSVESLVRWVDKLETYCMAEEAKLKALEKEAEDRADQSDKIKGLEEDIEHMIEDMMDVGRGIKTWEEIVREYA